MAARSSDRAIRNTTNEDARRDSAFGRVSFGQFQRNFPRALTLAQSHGRAAEAGASKPRPKNAWQFLRDRHKKVELGRAVFEILTRAFVRFVHQLAKADTVARFE